jgi:hypothetical protein
MTALRTGAMFGLAAALSVGVSACGGSSSGGSGSTNTASSTTAPAPITITQAWVRTTEGAMNTTMVPLFVTIKNSSASPVSIASGTSSVAGKIEFHEMAMKNGKMVMQPKASGITIPAGGTTVLKPNGDHIMLMALKQALPVGSEVTTDLSFSDGTVIKVVAPVKKFADGNAQYAGTGTATSSMKMDPSSSMSMGTSTGTTTP